MIESVNRRISSIASGDCTVLASLSKSSACSAEIVSFDSSVIFLPALGWLLLPIM